MRHHSALRRVPRNIWAVSITSFLTDISSEMIINILPLFLANVLGVRTSVIGLIEGVAAATASLLQPFSGWFSDRVGQRKWIAVAGYGLSTAVKPFYLAASAWPQVAAVRWADRVGKGIRTAPRDALVADSTTAANRGLAFGFHRAADTAGAAIGILAALLVVWWAQSGALTLKANTFRAIVLISLAPAVAAVIVLAVLARDVAVTSTRDLPKFGLRGLGRPFLIYLAIAGLFDLGNSSDAFLVLRAQEQGISVVGVLAMILTFNLVYALVSTPAGSLSDRVGRRRMLIAGWLVYATIYVGFGLATAGWQIWLLYVSYGLYYGLAYGTAKAFVADLVPAALRATAYGTYSALLGFIDLPASLIAGILWQGIGRWPGFGPSAPFLFGAGLALAAAVALALWRPTLPAMT